MTKALRPDIIVARTMEVEATAPVLDEGAKLLQRVACFPSAIRDKLCCYMLDGGWHRDDRRNAHKSLISLTPIKTLAVVKWLNPEYTRNNENAKRLRTVTHIMCTEPNTDHANKKVKELDDATRRRGEKAKRERLGWCSCCGYGGCKRAYMPWKHPRYWDPNYKPPSP